MSNNNDKKLIYHGKNLCAEPYMGLSLANYIYNEDACTKVKYTSRSLTAVHSAPNRAHRKLLWGAVVCIVLFAPHRQAKKEVHKSEIFHFSHYNIVIFFLIFISNCIFTLWYHDDILTSIVPTTNRNCKKITHSKKSGQHWYLIRKFMAWWCK